MNDLTGKKFGKLTVIGYSHKDNKKCRSGYWETIYYWKCECDCGNVVIVRANNLKTGNTKSCGCYRREIMLKKNKFAFPVLDTSGISITEEYEKFDEEAKEFKDALYEYFTYKNSDLDSYEIVDKKDHVIEECFDVIQVMWNLIDRINISKDKRQEAYVKHIEKMIERGWSIKIY